MLMGSICGGGAVVTSSSASETTFALAAFACFLIVSDYSAAYFGSAESDCALLRLCLPDRARDLAALSCWHVCDGKQYI